MFTPSRRLFLGTTLGGLTSGLAFGAAPPVKPAPEREAAPFQPDTLFLTWHGVNAHKKFPAGSTRQQLAARRDMSSFHPGGVNVAMCDGSVRFLKDSIDSWPITQTGSTGISLSNWVIVYAPGTQHKVLQALSTIA